MEPRWIFLWCTAQSRSDTVSGKNRSLLVLQANTQFPYKEMTLFLQDVIMRISRRTFREVPPRQGHPGSVIAGIEWELPAGSAVTVSWVSLACS